MKFKHVKVYNFLDAIRGMRNSYESWSKMDSYYEAPTEIGEQEQFILGENDYKLAMNLTKAGSGHDKYLRQILVSVDITTPEYWWKEFDTYKVGTVANSTSMMHTLGKRELKASDFAFDEPNDLNVKVYLMMINYIRRLWIKEGKKKPSPEWRMMIQLMANSFLYTRTVTMNYGVLKNIYHQRKNHRLKEWHEFNNWVETLPYSELITLKEV